MANKPYAIRGKALITTFFKISLLLIKMVWKWGRFLLRITFETHRFWECEIYNGNPHSTLLYTCLYYVFIKHTHTIDFLLFVAAKWCGDSIEHLCGSSEVHKYQTFTICIFKKIFGKSCRKSQELEMEKF